MGKAVMLVSSASRRLTRVGFVESVERRLGEDLKIMLLIGRKWRDLLADIAVRCVVRKCERW